MQTFLQHQQNDAQSSLTVLVKCRHMTLRVTLQFMAAYSVIMTQACSCCVSRDLAITWWSSYGRRSDMPPRISQRAAKLL